MKKVIHNRVYDTSTAIQKGSWESGPLTESLYRKKVGEFFLYRATAGVKPEEKLLPLSLDEARKWAADHLPDEDQQQLFAATTNQLFHLSAYLSPEAGAKLRRIAAESGQTISATLTDLISKA